MGSTTVRLADVLGQGATVRLLQRLVERGKLPHALLFEGPPGCGRRTLCRALTAALVCETPHDGDACGTCRACRLVAEGGHPDVVELPHDSEEESVDPDRAEAARAQLKADAVRDLIEVRAWETPLIARRRVFVLPVMERFQRSGGVIANVLLKVLEEPPPSTHFLLTTASVNALLATVRSRVQLYRLQPLGADDLAKVLVRGGLDQAEARRRAATGNGSHRGLWASEVDPAPVADLRRLLDQGLSQAVVSDLVARLPSTKEGGQGEARRVLRRWLLALQQDLRKDLPGPAGLQAVSGIDRTGRALHDLGLNIQPRLVLEGLALG